MKLVTIDISSFNFNNITTYNGTFTRCIYLENVYVKDETAKEFVDARLEDAELNITSTVKKEETVE